MLLRQLVTKISFNGGSFQYILFCNLGRLKKTVRLCEDFHFKEVSPHTRKAGGGGGGGGVVV